MSASARRSSLKRELGRDISGFMMRYGLVAVALAGCASAGKSGASTDAPPVVTPDAHEFFDAGNNEVIPDAPPDARIVMTDAGPPPPDAACVPVATELLANPAFDLTPVGTGWTEQDIDPTYPVITSAPSGLPAQSAPYVAWMGGITGDDIGASSATDVLYADVTVPAGTTQLVLTGYYAVATSETDPTPYDTASVDLLQTNGTPIEAILAMDNTTIATSYAQFTHTFTSNVAGQTVRLRFTSTNDIINATSFFFDTLSLQATHCP